MVVHGPYPVGEPRVSRQTAAALEAGWEVDVVAMRRPGEPAREVVEGADVYRLPLGHARGTGFVRLACEYGAFTALAALKVPWLAARRRYAVVQVHTPPDFLIVAGLAAKPFGAEVVLDIHDLSSDMFGMRFGSRPGSTRADRVLRTVERWATRVADAVITVHDPYRRELVSRGVPAEKISVVMNTVDERLLPAKVERAEASDEFRIVYHGAVTPAYGLELLVRSAASCVSDLPGLRLEIYGEGDAVEELRALAAELDVGDRVHLEGRSLPLAEVLQRVQGASLGVIPNLPTPLNRYALSSKLFEYVSLGMPVVVSGLPTLREHFSPEEVLFFEPGDSAALAEAILEVARNPASAHKRAEAAARRYESYRWPAQAQRYLAVLDHVTKRESS